MLEISRLFGGDFLLKDYIQFKDVKKIYKMGEVEIEALSGVDFSINKGEFVVVAGASGAGKSTILNILGGMDSPTSGEIIVDGVEVSKYSSKELTTYRRYDIGFVFQFYNLVQNLTVTENVELATQICKNPLDVAETVKAVGLEKRKDNFPAQLSGGEQQRVSIARAIVNNPKVLIADEPTGNLDPETAKEIMELIDDINKAGTTVVMATHAKEIVNSMKKRVIAIDKGEVVSDVQKGGYEYEV